MFTEYLINVAITAGAYLPLVFFTLVVALLMSPVAHFISEFKGEPLIVEAITKHRITVFKFAAILTLLILLFSALQPSNTYKHTGYNRDIEDQRINVSLENQHTKPLREITDRTRQPDLTREQRQDRFEELVDRTRITKQEGKDL